MEELEQLGELEELGELGAKKQQSKVNVVVGRWYEMMIKTVQISTLSIYWFIALLKSLLSSISDLVNRT